MTKFEIKKKNFIMYKKTKKNVNKQLSRHGNFINQLIKALSVRNSVQALFIFKWDGYSPIPLSPLFFIF